ncbi:hypothetical protein [Nesterenkonia flava]|uniref:Sensor domain-containing protein n=1 Tax=Nesterenkonia flava TaxID=469799 RepID=A0ABU1FUK2_9MICC|nr:hypothetical protein [Nesterenkonia flava]MDR5712348.1 hypothetical protein [Nesterenkonia flava]
MNHPAPRGTDEPVQQPGPASAPGIMPGHRGRRRLAALGLVGGLALLTACGQDDEVPEGETQAPDPAGAEHAVAAAAAGAERAASYGFDAAGFMPKESRDYYREQMTDPFEERQALEVTPAECADPLLADGWSPLLLETDAARVDFAAQTFAGQGSLEVAPLENQDDRDRAQEYQQAVEELIASCSEVEFSTDDGDFVLEISEPELQADLPDTTAFVWERRAAGAESPAGTETAQILFTPQDDDVVMVSFMGESAAGSEEFTQIAEAITEETLAALGETTDD